MFEQTFKNIDNILHKDAGFEELDQARLPNLIELKYNTLTDASEALGGVDEIRNLFFSFQKQLYERAVSSNANYAVNPSS